MYTRMLVAGAAGIMLPLLACSENPELKPDFRQHATETVDITLGDLPLHFAASFMDDHDADVAAVKDALKGVKSVRIRNYQFDSDFPCSQTDIGPLRSQLSGPGWSHLVEEHNRTKAEDVDVYLAVDDQVVKGVAIIACQPREYTIVNITGTVNLSQLARLRKTFSPGTTGTM